MSRRRNSAPASLASTFRWRVAMPLAIACGVLVPALAEAASLSGPVTGWSSGVPSYISMYEYVPATLAASPPVVVAAHYCGGSASAMFGFTGMPAIEAAADKYGFIMIFPQTTNPASSADCWDVGSTKSLTHNGGGDTQAIAEMVQYEVTKRNANPNRVYAMGASSGAMLTEALMAVYPDVFKAGAEFSGVPAGCWSDGWSAASNWGGTCANGQDTMTADAWGNLVRGMYPGYSGYRPRLQLWHGTADATIKYPNQGEAIKEWTNVLGLNATPNSTDTTTDPGYTIEKWQNSCGFTVLEAHTQAGGGHTTPIDANSVIAFFGLATTGLDPEIAACDGGSASGSSSSSGQSGASSTSHSGSTGSSSTVASGSEASSGTVTTSHAGTSGTSGTSEMSGASGTSTQSETSGSKASSGAGGSANGSSESSGSGESSSDGSDSKSGCSCRVGSAGGAGSAGGLLLVAAVMLLGRRKATRA